MCSLLCVTSSLSFFSSLVLPSLTAFYVWWLWTLELIWPFSRVVHLSPHSCEKRKGWLSSKHMSLVCTLCTLFKSSVEVIQPHCEWGCYNDFCYTVSRNTSSNSDEVWKHHSNPEGGSEKTADFLFDLCHQDKWSMPPKSCLRKHNHQSKSLHTQTQQAQVWILFYTQSLWLKFYTLTSSVQTSFLSL